MLRSVRVGQQFRQIVVSKRSVRRQRIVFLREDERIVSDGVIRVAHQHHRRLNGIVDDRQSSAGKGVCERIGDVLLEIRHAAHLKDSPFAVVRTGRLWANRPSVAAQCQEILLRLVALRLPDGDRMPERTMEDGRALAILQARRLEDVEVELRETQTARGLQAAHQVVARVQAAPQAAQPRIERIAGRLRKTIRQRDNRVPGVFVLSVDIVHGAA